MSLISIVAEYERKTRLQAPMVSEEEFYEALELGGDDIRFLYELYRCQHTINVMIDKIAELEAVIHDMREEC